MPPFGFLPDDVKRIVKQIRRLEKMPRNHSRRWPSRKVLMSGGAGAFSGAQVAKTGDQSVTASTLTAVTWNTEVYDTDSYHDNVTNNHLLTIPKDGWYQIGVIVGVTHTGAAGYGNLILHVGATSYFDQRTIGAPGSNGYTLAVNTEAELSASAQVYAEVFLALTTPTIIYTASQFWISKIR